MIRTLKEAQDLYDLELTKNAAMSRCILEASSILRAQATVQNGYGNFGSADTLANLAGHLESVRAANYSAPQEQDVPDCVREWMRYVSCSEPTPRANSASCTICLAKMVVTP